MAKVELIMPKMGESIMEATILNWTKSVGDTVEMDETILEIATDKVDSEVPSPVDGVIQEILFQKDDVVAVGAVIAYIQTEVEATNGILITPEAPSENGIDKTTTPQPEPVLTAAAPPITNDKGTRFYSPLVRNIAQKEGIAIAELETVTGSGQNGRVTKKDILAYVENRKQPVAPVIEASHTPQMKSVPTPPPNFTPPPVSRSGNVELIEMGRMRQLIAKHMVMSKHVSPHVTSFVEADVTDIVQWRKRVKGDFQQQYNEKITYTPIFIEAVTKAIKDFPLINASVDGTTIIRKKDINIGMAAATPSGNLIVPVIKNADHLSLVGLTKQVNDLADRARSNKLKPDEIQNGTFTLTNVGTFGNVMGTPIINQPQVAIMAVGAIQKKPAVLETEYGDIIAIRHKMFLSLSYDHRVVDGFLGGSFLRRVADYLEAFDKNRAI